MAKPESDEQEKSAGNLNDEALEEITGGRDEGMARREVSGKITDSAAQGEVIDIPDVQKKLLELPKTKPV